MLAIDPATVSVTGLITDKVTLRRLKEAEAELAVGALQEAVNEAARAFRGVMRAFDLVLPRLSGATGRQTTEGAGAAHVMNQAIGCCDTLRCLAL